MKPSFIILSLIFVVSCTQQKLLTKYDFTDSDLDGVHDDRDACPHEPGSFFNMGCPDDESRLSLAFNKEKSTDSDLDGVPDDKDECPEVYGSPFNQGCPFKTNPSNPL